MNKKALIIPVLLIPAIALGVTWYRHREAISKRETIYGNVDIREATLSFRVAGRVAAFHVDEGAAVKAGEVLASLDPEPLRNALSAAEGTEGALAARNRLFHRGYRSEDVEQAKARLASAKAALEEAERQLARQRKLVPEGVAPQTLLDAAQTARDQAAAQMKLSEEQVRAMTTGFRKEEVAESDSQYRQAQAMAGTARLALQDSVLKAPSDGIILTRSIEKGTMVQSGTPAFSLSLTDPIWVRAYVSEAQLGLFAPGAKVTLHTDARPDKAYRGIVGFVSPTAEFTPKPVETPDLRTSLVYRLRIRVEDGDALLRQGMPVTVRLAK
ncbi:MAG: secretion protein HlyD [Firmicutes bacterium]|nr:secretion protein HlyD [Bacillota bacterium]